MHPDCMVSPLWPATRAKLSDLPFYREGSSCQTWVLRGRFLSGNHRTRT